jgi:ABC-2 type transport system permease protein
MDALSVTAGALRYEFLMQIRRRSIWLVLILVSAMSAILWLAFISGSTVTSLDAVMYLAQFTAWFLPLGVGLVLADRLARDKKLRVDEILDAFPGSLGARLVGKYLGSTLATLVPVALFYLSGVGYILARFHDPHSLLLALATFAAIPLPGTLFAAGFSRCQSTRYSLSDTGSGPI